MDLSIKLSLLACYYIRKLLHKHRSELKSIVAQGAGLCANPKADLNQVLESLYLEEAEIAEKVQQLEALTRRHKILTTRNSPTNHVVEIERQIFWILGLK